MIVSLLKQLGPKREYLFAAIIAIFVVNCAHQSDDDYMRNQMPHPHQQVMVAPPPIPPHAPASAMPGPVKPSVPREAAVSVPIVAKPKVSETTKKAEKAPDLSNLQLKLTEALTPPVRRLINNADENLKKGKVLEARSQADRAYRMDLRDPRTSFLMAKVSAAEKDYDGAEQWAMRAIENLEDAENKQIVWGLIARIREKSGNKVGAAEAMKKRNEFRR